MPKRKLSPQSIFDEPELMEFMKNHRIKPEHAHTLWRFVIRNPRSNIADCPELPKIAYDLLPKYFVTFTTKLESVSTSSDGTTTKLLVRLQDGSLVETVIMRYDRKNRAEYNFGKPRATVCISSQVGCKMGCTFCATGTMGLKSHLTAGEIIEQLVHASTIEPIKNVVFMGMGEPLDNYDAVLMAIRAMTDVRRFNLGLSHICISTVGVVPRMKQLLTDAPGVSLAVSLHAPTQEMRTQIVPTAKAWPIERIIEAIDAHLQRGYRVMIEYIVIGNVNASKETAHLLGELLKGKKVLINLIPYNPTDVSQHFEPPTDDQLDEFEKIIRHDYKLVVTVRRTMGQDIDGACGQLVVKKNKEDNMSCTSSNGLTDIEDLTKPVTPKKNPKVTKLPRKQITSPWKRAGIMTLISVSIFLLLSHR